MMDMTCEENEHILIVPKYCVCSCMNEVKSLSPKAMGVIVSDDACPYKNSIF